MSHAVSTPIAGHLDPAYPLDREVAALLTVRARWGLAGLLAALALPLAILAVALPVALLRLPSTPLVEQGYGLLAAGVAAAGIVRLGRPLVRRYGGWRAALGVSLPARGDGRLVVGWVPRQLLVRVALVVLAVGPGSSGSNVDGVSALSPASLLLVTVGAVLVAPALEELLFRGVLLRALLRRLPFWPAAALCSVVFGALHAQTVGTVQALAPVVLATGVFGLLQCQLVRRTARLGPAMAVHGLTNLLVLAFALLAGA
jgi:membrane protease YdiL (CAAX protease family)